jgi:hypothetical protein
MVAWVCGREGTVGGKSSLSPIVCSQYASRAQICH